MTATRTAPSRWRSGIAAACLMFVVIGCGLPSDDEPRAISSDELPPKLVGSVPDVSPTEVPGTESRFIYVTDRGGEVLVPIAIAVPEPADPRAMLEALLEKPVLPEGNTSWIPEDLTLEGFETTSDVEIEREDGEVVRGNLATISLSDEITNIENPSQRLAIAQIVYTVTAGDVNLVQFRVDDKVIQVPTGEARGSDRVVARDDYEDLAPAN